MATTILPKDFKEFLKLLNLHKVEYLVIGGYAVNYYGYIRATVDIDIWISINKDTADKMTEVLKEFGFDTPNLSPELFLKEKNIIRMGIAPFRIEILNSISGVNFEECYNNKIVDNIDNVEVNIIDIDHLKKNKKASGRLKDLSDLDYLP